MRPACCPGWGSTTPAPYAGLSCSLLMEAAAAAAVPVALEQQQWREMQQPAMQAAGSAVDQVARMQGSLQHTQRSLGRVGANLAAIQGALSSASPGDNSSSSSSSSSSHSSLAAQQGSAIGIL
ncbi:hypothetical protein OEZ86_013163 [Tetradesmus obliquus]|nr:hypothetical protein OEZ86_013163 [Tetradesmus obliquus]